jgi:hypothetical protein
MIFLLNRLRGGEWRLRHATRGEHASGEAIGGAFRMNVHPFERNDRPRRWTDDLNGTIVGADSVSDHAMEAEVDPNRANDHPSSMKVHPCLMNFRQSGVNVHADRGNLDTMNANDRHHQTDVHPK